MFLEIAGLSACSVVSRRSTEGKEVKRWTDTGHVKIRMRSGDFYNFVPELRFKLLQRQAKAIHFDNIDQRYKSASVICKSPLTS